MVITILGIYERGKEKTDTHVEHRFFYISML